MGTVSGEKIIADFNATDGGRLERTPAAPLAAEMPVDPNGRSIQVLSPVAGSTVAVASGAASAASAAVGTAGIYSVTATLDAYVEKGATPTATATTMYLAGGIPMFMRLAATDKIAALQKAAAGVVHITRWE